MHSHGRVLSAQFRTQLHIRLALGLTTKQKNEQMVQNWIFCVRHEAHCYIARIAGMDWRRCLWI